MEKKNSCWPPSLRDHEATGKLPQPTTPSQPPAGRGVPHLRHVGVHLPGPGNSKKTPSESNQSTRGGSECVHLLSSVHAVHRGPRPSRPRTPIVAGPTDQASGPGASTRARVQWDGSARLLGAHGNPDPVAGAIKAGPNQGIPSPAARFLPTNFLLPHRRRRRSSR